MRAVILAGLGLALAASTASTESVEPPHVINLAAGGSGQAFVDLGDLPTFGRPRFVLRQIAPAPEAGEESLVLVRRSRRVSGKRWRFKIGKAPAGRFEVLVRRRGRPDLSLTDAFLIEPPSLSEPDVFPVQQGRTLDVYGQFFSRSGYQVRLGDRRMRVVGPRSNGSASIRIPKRFPDGDYPLTLTTSAGSDTAETFVRVGGPLFQFVGDVRGELQPVADLGFDAPDRPRGYQVNARPREPGLVQITMGVVHSRRAFNELVFAIPDVFHADINEPLTLRAEWAVLSMRSNEAEREAPPEWWYRPDGLVVTVEAFDLRSGYFLARFTGGLNPTDEFGEPREGASIQVRGGRIGTILNRSPREPEPGKLVVDFRDESQIDADVTTASVEFGTVRPAPGYPVESILQTHFQDLLSFDALLGTPTDGHISTNAPPGTALLIEMQAAPSLYPDRPILRALPDLAGASEWVPVRLWDATGAPAGAFADRGYPRADVGILRTFPLDGLNDLGHRVVRFRITLLTQSPPIQLPGYIGPEVRVSKLSIPVTRRADLR